MEAQMKCPYCERPYIRVSNGKVRILVTHAPGCPITDAEDRKLKREARAR